MKVTSNLPRFVKFGKIEVKPNENIFNKKDSDMLSKHKGFNQYVKNKDFTVEVPATAAKTTTETK